jgi:hypothetical protein
MPKAAMRSIIWQPNSASRRMRRTRAREIALQASSTTGISQDTLAKMLPVIASMIFGGLMKSIENQGFDAVLGQLANAARQGDLGSILGQILGGGQSPTGLGQPPSATPGPAGRGQGGLAVFWGPFWEIVSASAGFRCGLNTGGSPSPHQNAAARNPAARGPAKRH